MNAAPVDELDELRAAAAALRRAVTGRRQIAADDLAGAHATIRQYHPHTTGDLHAAINHYLAHHTWHHGPLPLLAAINLLCKQLQLPAPPSDIAEQLRLFTPPHQPG